MRSVSKRSMILLVLVLALLPMPAHAEIITTPFSEFANGDVVINFDHNRGNGNVLRFRCINNADQDAWLGVYDCPNGECTLVGDAICYAGETYEVNVPGISVAWKCELLDPEHPEWGEDCGLDMADYQFHARYPAN